MASRTTVICYCLLVIALCSSCVDTVILPDNKTVDDDFWQKKTEVDGVVATAYAQLRDQVAIRNMIVWGDFRSDELLIACRPTDSYYIPLQQLYSLNIEPENMFTNWAPFYSAINYCNLVLEKAEAVIYVDPDYTRGDYDSNRAQMLALRAFCYYYLTRVFRDVPVTPAAYMNSSDDLNAQQKTQAEILDMCINDLNEAAKYAVSGSTYGDWRDRGYFNQDGINALLADIYLWRASVNRDASDYQACVQCCDKVIKAKKDAYESAHPGLGAAVKDYYLSDVGTMYNDLYGKDGQNAQESIFELQFKESNYSNTGMDQMYFRFRNNSSNSYGYLQAHPTYANEDTGGNGVWNNKVDQRLYDFFYDATKSGVNMYGVRKFVATQGAKTNQADATRDTRSGFSQNWIVYRLTDVMLMKAEALVQLYELNGKDPADTRNQEAFDLCKAVNDRALNDLSKSLSYGVYKDKMESLVLAERARELCFEGKRWFDLMRYNYRHTATPAKIGEKLNDSYVANSEEFFALALRKYTVPSAMKAKMRDERYLYMPINQDEVEINTSLVQNSAYKSTTKKQ